MVKSFNEMLEHSNEERTRLVDGATPQPDPVPRDLVRDAINVYKYLIGRYPHLKDNVGIFRYSNRKDMRYGNGTPYGSTLLCFTPGGIAILYDEHYDGEGEGKELVTTSIYTYDPNAIGELLLRQSDLAKIQNAAATPQPDPTPGGVDIYPLVIKDIEARIELITDEVDTKKHAKLIAEDIEARAEMGKEKYGTVLQSNNGRDALMDAYQEALDLAIYLRQALEEKK